MNLDFLTLSGEGAVARSPIEHLAQRAGARCEVRDGWNVAVAFPGEDGGDAAASSAAWADMSHLGKLELQGPTDALDRVAGEFGVSLSLGEAARASGAWWCRVSGERALVVGDVSAVRERLEAVAADAAGVSLLDVTSGLAALTIVGPLAREVFARFCALDLRPARTPVRAVRPGSIARQPGILVCEDENRYLFLFGAATAEYMWEVVSDAGGHLGGRPIGVDALPALSTEEALSA
jgi:heterotetrameric sarcosine oxidase gamma subunit